MNPSKRRAFGFVLQMPLEGEGNRYYAPAPGALPVTAPAIAATPAVSSLNFAGGPTGLKINPMYSGGWSGGVGPESDRIYTPEKLDSYYAYDPATKQQHMWDTAGNYLGVYKDDPWSGVKDFVKGFVLPAVGMYTGITALGGLVGAGTAATGAGAAATGSSVLAMPSFTAAVANPGLAIGSAISNSFGVAMSPTTAAFLGDTIYQTALNGGDVGKALTNAATSFGINLAGTELSKVVGNVVKDIPGLDAVQKSAITNGVANATIAGVMGRDPLASLAASATNYLVPALANQIPGYAALPAEAKRIATSAMMAELAGKSPTDAAVNTALQLGKNALISYADTSLGISAAVKNTINDLKNKTITADTSKVASDMGTLTDDDVKSITGLAPGEEKPLSPSDALRRDIAAADLTPDEKAALLAKVAADDSVVTAQAKLAPTFISDAGTGLGRINSSFAANDPIFARALAKNPSLGKSIGEYMNSYGPSPAGDEGYLSNLLDAINDATPLGAEPLREEVARILKRSPSLASPEANAALPLSMRPLSPLTPVEIPSGEVVPVETPVEVPLETPVEIPVTPSPLPVTPVAPEPIFTPSPLPVTPPTPAPVVTPSPLPVTPVVPEPVVTPSPLPVTPVVPEPVVTPSPLPVTPVVEPPVVEPPLTPLEPVLIPPTPVAPVVTEPVVTPKTPTTPVTSKTPTASTTSAPSGLSYADPAALAGYYKTVGKMGSDMSQQKLQQLYTDMAAPAETSPYTYVEDVAPETVDIAKMMGLPSQYSWYAGGGEVKTPTDSDFYSTPELLKSLKELGAKDSGTKPPQHNVREIRQMGTAAYSPKILPQLAALLQARGMHLADGGQPSDQNHPNYDGTPVFRTGGLSGLGGKYVQGHGDGTSDDISAMLADGEYVFSADVVSALGNGSNKAGADKLSEMVHAIRSRARSASPDKLPPDAKSPLEYLKSSKGKKNG